MGINNVPMDLSGLQLGRDVLQSLVSTVHVPSWWDSKRAGLNFADASLHKANLENADLTGANLARANLAGTLGRSANFHQALAEEADFSRADLSGACFTAVAGGQAKFTAAMLEDANFANAALRFAQFADALLDGANFSVADLWGANFAGADADYTNFKGARLDEANLSDAHLTYAVFEEATLTKASLSGSRLRGARFTGAKLDGADLSAADLSSTDLVRLNLSSCNLRHARFAGAWINGTRFRIEQLGGAVGEEIAGEYEAAQASYLALEQNLKSIGSHHEASWAYKRGRRMGRYQSGRKALSAWRVRDLKALVRHGYRWGADRFVEWLCDYGESLSRIVRAFVLLILLFGALYAITGGLIPEASDGTPTRNFVDLVSYSALNMMTANPPEIGIKPIGRVTNLLVGLQGALGIILMGLFGFVLGNRMRR
ncbi:pentapeptide repeat-containing protein [Methylobacterium oxalidis]